MKSKFNYYNPVKVFFERDAVKNHPGVFGVCGKKAMIVTGRTSAKKCGAYGDVTDNLKQNAISYCTFDRIENNPSMESVEEAAALAVSKKVDFIVGIGGGSPIDASNSISVLCANPDMRVIDLFTNFKNIPHGKANGLLMKEYIVYNYPVVKEKIDTAMKLLQCESIDDFLDKLEKLIGVAPSLTDEEVERYTELTMLQKGSIANTPNPLNEEKIHQFWKRMQ